MTTAAQLNAMIAECEREIRMRNSVYSSLVRKGRLTQAESDNQISLMRQVVETLKDISQPALPMGQALESEQRKLSECRDELRRKQAAVDAMFPFCDRDLRSIEASMTDDYLLACRLVKSEATNGGG